MFGEADTNFTVTDVCCDVCANINSTECTDLEEFKILNDALQQVGSKGELKVCVEDQKYSTTIKTVFP